MLKGTFLRTRDHAYTPKNPPHDHGIFSEASLRVDQRDSVPYLHVGTRVTGTSF